MHDALGRFARTGAVRVELEGPRLRKSRAQPESAARQRWEKARERTARVNRAFADLGRGRQVTEPLVYFRGKAARPDLRHERTLDRTTALEHAVAGLHGSTGQGFRHDTRRAFNGKGLAVRGYKSREFPGGWIRGFGKRTRVLNGAGKKPTPRRARDILAATPKPAAYRPRHGAPEPSAN